MPEEFFTDSRVPAPADYYLDPKKSKIFQKYQQEKDFYAFVFNAMKEKPFHFELKLKPVRPENSGEPAG